MKQYVVDAFTDRVFHGNQAAVCVLDAWLPEELMMNITRENNFSETAFTVREGEKCICAGSRRAGRSTSAVTPPLAQPSFCSITMRRMRSR
ncbi:MAG: PhzF family phenazine biosynthesis protein, partial [Oscillospiraceae bacterium]|nr:PhzF family phenazine biosynthesis protein [Oscillospiraceae bacterium]